MQPVMARVYFYTPPTSNYIVGESQDEQVAFLGTVDTSIKKDVAGTNLYEPPANHFLFGEPFLHTGYDNGSGPETFLYQPAIELEERAWDFDPTSGSPSFTDHHLVPKLLRLLPDQSALVNIVDLAPTEPTVTSAVGKDFYRNATYAAGLGFGANNNDNNADPSADSFTVVPRRSSSTCGLGQSGLPAAARIADIQGDIYSVILVGDWAVPLVGLSNQAWAVNLITGARSEFIGFSDNGQISSLELDTDPTNPPWGASFTDYPFTQTIVNVIGALNSEVVITCEEEQDFTLNVISDFATKSITKTLTPPSWLNPPAATNPPFVWTSPPHEGTGAWYDWYVCDRGSLVAPGIDTSNIDNDLDDAGYDPSPSGASGTVYASFGRPISGPSFPNRGLMPVHPSNAAPPIRVGESPPLPESPFFCQSLAEVDGIRQQMLTDLNGVVNLPRWRGWKQVRSRIRFVFRDVTDMSEVAEWVPDPDYTSLIAGTVPIIRGPSLVQHEIGDESDVGQVEQEGYPGHYKPEPRSAPAGYFGGTEGNLELNGMGQFLHYSADLSATGRTQFAFYSGDTGNAPGPLDDSGIYITSGPGQAPLPAGLFGWTAAFLTTIFAPTPEGWQTAQKPLPFHCAKFVTNGTWLIFLPRDVTIVGHYASFGEELDDYNAEIERIHKIVALEFSGNKWIKRWEFDTFEHMGGVYENEQTGEWDPRSGDCLSNGFITNNRLYCDLWGARGEIVVEFDVTRGVVVSECQVRGPGLPRYVNPAIKFCRDSLMVSDRVPLLLSASGWLRMEIDESDIGYEGGTT